jgi:hypothetical protein
MTDTASPSPADNEQPADASVAAQPERVPQQPIYARYGRYYRNARYIMVAAIFVMAGWFAYDGWHAWPEDNRRIDEVITEIAQLQSDPDANKERLADLDRQAKDLGTKHSDLALLLQKLLAVGLPILGICYLTFVIRRSRGTFTLDNDTLHAPGHPAVHIDQIAEIDGKLWRKKGIAFLKYANVEGKSGTIRLDAFIYDPKPMDDLYEVIARRHGIWEQTKPLPPSADKA